MTQPDGLFPPAAWNFDSIASLAAMTGDDWNAQITAQALSGHQAVLGQTYDANGLPTGTGNNLSSTLINAVLSSCCGCAPGGGNLTQTMGNLQTQVSDQVPGGVQNNPSLPFGMNLFQTLFGFCCGCNPGGSNPIEMGNNVKAQFNSMTGMSFDDDQPLAINGAKSVAQRFTPFTLQGNTITDLLDEVQGIYTNLTVHDLGGLPGFGTLINGLSLETLPGDLQDSFERWQAQLDTLVNGFTGATIFGHDLDDLSQALHEIQPGSILGVGGALNIGEAILEGFRQLAGGAVGDSGAVDVSFADLFNIFKIVSSRSTLGEKSYDLLAYRNNKASDKGYLPSGVSNFPSTEIDTTHAATQAASVITTHHIEASQALGVVSWLGFGTSGLTAFYINIWKIATNGDWTLAHHSGNFVGSLAAGTTPQWNFYEVPTPLATVAGEDYAYELEPVGGTHNVRGKVVSLTNTPAHPYSPRVAHGATRDNTSSPNSPSTPIVKASVTRSANVPWIETAISLGTTGDFHAPQPEYLSTAGDYIIPIPTWSNQIDVIVVPSAGGGHIGSLFTNGGAGKPGVWVSAMWLRGTDYDDSVDEISITIPPGGLGGSSSHNSGFDADDITVSIPGHTVTGVGGIGATFFAPQFTKPVGLGPTPRAYIFNDETYVAGGNQSNTSENGSAPGGAGNGGGSWFDDQSGGDGATGAVWLLFRMGEEVDGTPPTGTDTTPPTAPTSVTVSVTPSTITVSASGGIDP